VVGEGIELMTQSKADLWPIKADPSHLEQVLMNLAVNARDAMSGQGRLTVTTENVTLDKKFTETHTNVTPGDYVLLTASDTGSGMSDEVKSRIFEPFFTTKEKGKGTGLGLATCYGIIKGNGGHIVVESEIGRGTRFKIYQPRTQESETTGPADGDVRKAPRGTETILLVEDEQALRTFVSRVLRELGYNVIEAPDGREALHLAQKHGKVEIHLLFTDVVLPMIGGKVLADRLRKERPQMRVLFTSGYTDDVLAEHGVLKPGVDLIRKPFWPVSLALKVRAVMDAV